MAIIPDVKDDGLIVEVDGVEYAVNPYDASASACWYGTMEVEISGSKLTNKATGQTIQVSSV